MLTYYTIIVNSGYATQMRYYLGRKFSAVAAQVETYTLFYISDRVDEMRWLYFEQRRGLDEANVILLTFFTKFYVLYESINSQS